MSTLQAFVLGVMAAWTPSLVFLAWSLWRVPSTGFEDVPSVSTRNQRNDLSAIRGKHQQP
jgi:hypothetical protein